jgi:signal transduction histidine kinase
LFQPLSRRYTGWATASNPSVFGKLLRRLTLWYAGVFAIILIGFALLTYTYTTAVLVADLDAEIRLSETDLQANLVQHGRLLVKPRDLKSEIEDATTAYGPIVIQVFDPGGRRILTHPAGFSVLPMAGPRWTDWQEGTGRWRMHRITLKVGRHSLGVLIVGRPLNAVEIASAHLFRTLSLAVPLALCLTVVAGSFLAQLAIRPVVEAFEQQRRFIADASHELRTPVTLIQTQAEVTLDDPDSDLQTLRDSLEIVHRTGLRMGRLVADLLFLSRADARTMLMQREKIDLAGLVRELVADFRTLASAGGVTLTAETPVPLPLIAGDQEKIWRLIGNLLSNAIAHTPKGGTVTVTATYEAPHVVVIVTDTGAGIEPVALPHVFERFFRAEQGRDRNSGGSGLGLAIAETVALAHGGWIEVTSPPGHGATFVLRLPVDPAHVRA